ncbi:TonB-dependent receptor plug domain-containing protein [Dendrosporobacter sp. 1207_IL3150]|uniref:TonB-dependent receptor plug domain-containing protein n=1 Tax=Dendrosporobacter sp. 1207_IL3150 TaxID=3084054 RepID=UPI002FD9E838
MNKKNKQLLCSLLTSAIVLGASQAAWAEESVQPEYSLDEYIITANRIPMKRTEIAANVTVINRAEIEKGNFNSVPDILKKSNVTIEKTANSSVPILNGDDRVLVLVDGRRMHWEHLIISGNDHAGVNLDQVSVNNIERIEIVRGPASSLYGSDAVGGVINIITRKADKTQTTVGTEFGAWGSQRYSLTTEGKTKDIGYQITAEKKKRDSFEYKDSKTGQTKTFADTQQDQQLLTLRLDKDLTDGRSISLQLENTEDNSGFGAYVNPDGTSHYPGAYTITNHKNFGLAYQWGKDKGIDNTVRVYHNQSDSIAYGGSLFKSDGVSPYTYDLSATGIDWQQNWKLNDKHTLVGGADWRNEALNDEDSIDKDFTTTAFFLEDRWQLPSNWTVSVGTRYDDHSVAGGKFTSRLTANREINSTTNIYASWGQYVKNPTIAQLFSNTIWWKGNPDLRPENGETITLGINTKLANDTILQANVYQSDIKDAINWKFQDWDGPGPGTSYTKYINVDNEKRKGLDISLSRQLSQLWSVSAGYSYVKVQNKTNSAASYINDPDNSQPNGYRLNVQFEQDKWDSSLTLRSATGRNLSRFTNESYLTLDMAVNYKISPETNVYFKGFNLTNEAYESISPGQWGVPGAYPMPARSFYLGVQHKI